MLNSLLAIADDWKMCFCQQACYVSYFSPPSMPYLIITMYAYTLSSTSFRARQCRQPALHADLDKAPWKICLTIAVSLVSLPSRLPRNHHLSALVCKHKQQTHGALAIVFAYEGSALLTASRSSRCHTALAPVPVVVSFALVS
jgi:hypothetical protein